MPVACRIERWRRNDLAGRRHYCHQAMAAAAEIGAIAYKCREAGHHRGLKFILVSLKLVAMAAGAGIFIEAGVVRALRYLH